MKTVTETAPAGLSHEEVLRYSRHLVLPQVGLDGQRTLKASRVLCIGAGGLGSPVAMYLAAAGVGTIGLVDRDRVETSNLQRQLLHGTADVGRSKLASARDRVAAINPRVVVETHETSLSSHNALDLLSSYQVIVDGTDNFPTRYLINDACVLLGKPEVYGSVFRFEGQVSVFGAPGGPCYRCLFPEPPPPGLVPSCEEGGILGVLPGIIGVIQATEVIKLILGVGEPLVGRFLVLDALRMRFRELRLEPDPDCPSCGQRPTIHELVDYEELCGLYEHRSSEAALLAEQAACGLDIDAEELRRRIERGDPMQILDVREPLEYDICRVPGSRLLPLAELPRQLGSLDPSEPVVVLCKVGARSARAVDLLRRHGFDRAVKLRGGIIAWLDRVDPSQPKY